LANVDRLSQFFYQNIPNKTFYATITGLPPYLNCVAPLPCEIQKSEITAEFEWNWWSDWHEYHLVISLFVALWKCRRQLHNRRCVWRKVGA